MIQYGVALFYTTSAVMRTEKLLIQQGYATRLIPTPRQFSSDCGIALRFDWSFREQVRRILDEAKVELAAMHLLA